MQVNQNFLSQPEAHKNNFNKRLEDIGWALFLILIGVIWLLPVGRLPENTWLIGAGIILLGINAIRYLKGISMSGFTLVLGTLALVAGLSGVFAVKLPFFAILFILIGTSILLKPLLGRRLE